MPEPVLLSVAETATALGLSLASVKRLVAVGALPSVKIGDRRLVHRDEVERLARTGTR